MDTDAAPPSSWAPPFLSPFLSAPDAYADAVPLGTEALVERARSLLPPESDPVTASAHGAVGIQADQAHYSAGYALLLPLPQSTAVAVTPVNGTDAPELAIAGTDDRFSLSALPDDRPVWADLVARITTRCLGDRPVHVAVAGTVPGVCRDGYLAALAVACARACRALRNGDAPEAPARSTPRRVRALRDELLPGLRADVEAAAGLPFGPAPLIAATVATPPQPILIDTDTREHLPVRNETEAALRWAVVDLQVAPPLGAAAHRHRRQQAEQALAILQEHGFPGLEAFRDLEHRDVQRAMDAVPADFRPVVRHLVTENRRVQKQVAALRRGDGQMVGALLLMSHASRRDHWGEPSAPLNAAVSRAEDLTMDGLYGAAQADRAGALLVTGRAPAFPATLSAFLGDGPGRVMRV